MMRHMWKGHREARASRTGSPVFGSAALGLIALAGSFIVAPAQAQWIGSPGGGTVEVEPGQPSASSAAPATAPAAAAPAAPTEPMPTLGNAPLGTSLQVSPSLSSGGLPTGGMSMGGAPGMAPSIGAPAAAPSGPSQADMADCQTNVNKLRDDVEARGKALQNGSKKKVSPVELCPLFRNYVSSQQKFYTYLRTNKSKCGVPDELLSKLKENNGQAATVRDKVCNIAANGGGPGGPGGPSGPPPQSSVAAGLGLSSGLPGAGASKPGGVFDTIGGSALR